MNDPRARGFLQHIAADPDDDAPRLIFADWLEEHGDIDRADLIRVQIERARLPKWDARQVRLALREQELLARHGEKWRAELPDIKGVDWVKWGEFRRGFVAEATFATFAALRDGAKACCAAAPLEAVSVRWPHRQEKCTTIPPIAGLRELSIHGNVVDPEDVARLADAPLLSTLRVLAIANASLMAEGFQRLTASPHLGNLKVLRLPGRSIGNSGVRPLFEAPSLDSLEELDLSERTSYGRYGEDPILESTGLEALVGWPGMSRIRSLNLSGNSVGQRGLWALLRSPRTTGLKELVLRHNGLPGQALQELEHAWPELRLDVLDLSQNPLRDLGAACLARSGCLRELKVLELEACEMSSAAAHALAEAPFFDSLRRLNVGYNNVRREGLLALLDGWPQQMHTLLLRSSQLDHNAVSALAKSPAADALLELDLTMNGLGDQAARDLAKTNHLRSLLILRLHYNRIYEEVADALRDSPLGKRLAVLELPPSRSLSDEDEIPF